MTNIPDPNDQLDRRLIRALETSPLVAIPQNFAQRVAAAAPLHPPAFHANPRGIGISMAWVAAALMLLVIFATQHTAAHWLQLTFQGEFIGLIGWLSLRHSLSSN